MDKRYLKDYCCFYSGGSAISDRQKQAEGNSKRPLGLSKGRLRPLSRGNRLLQIKITVIKGRQI